MTALQGSTVLLVEDDLSLRAALGRALGEAGARVSAVGDGAGALQATGGTAGAFSLIVLDIGLPDADGRDVCQAMRSRAVTAPILFLTARGQVDDVVSGFTAGGDDYLGKPFATTELLARCAALVRRAAGVPTPAAGPGLVLDPLSHGLRGSRGTTSLTPTEFRVLAALVNAGGAVVRRRQIARAGWSEAAHVAENTLDQYVARLRRKVAAVHAGPERIHTTHGVGYRFG